MKPSNQTAFEFANQFMHPDGFDEADSGWPRVLKRSAAEAWRRADSGEMADEELYPSDATWSGIHDRMHTHKPEEIERRFDPRNGSCGHQNLEGAF